MNPRIRTPTAGRVPGRDHAGGAGFDPHAVAQHAAGRGRAGLRSILPAIWPEPASRPNCTNRTRRRAWSSIRPAGRATIVTGPICTAPAWPGRRLDSLLLTGHVDTVALGDNVWASPPFVPEIRDGRLYGLGTIDMKEARWGQWR